jgi:hypothetical protein
MNPSHQALTCAFVLAFAFGAREAAVGQPTPGSGRLVAIAKPQPVNYREIRGVYTVVGSVEALDNEPSCRGEVVIRNPDGTVRSRSPLCVGLPLFSVRPTLVCGAPAADAVLVHLPLSGWEEGRPLRVGDAVALTVEPLAEVDMWSCGRLAPCDKRPSVVNMVVELFRLIR